MKTKFLPLSPIHIHIITLLGLLLGTSGCVTSKPDTVYSSHPDYNERVSVADAHYRTITTPVGIGFTLAGTVAGGYAGYSMEGGVVSQQGEFREPMRPVNAIIGASLGFATTQLVLQLMGKNQSKPSVDAQKWVRQMNKNYIIISKTSEVDFEIIPRQSEYRFEVKSIEDVSGFYYAFPQSQRKDQIFMQGVENLVRADLPALIQIDPGNQHRNDAIYKYYDQSSSIIELFEAVDQFTLETYPVEEKAASLVYSMADLALFQAKFGLQSKFNNQVFDQLYPVVEIQQLLILLKQYPAAAHKEDAMLHGIQLCQNMTDIGNFLPVVDKFKREIETRAEAIVFSDTYQIEQRYKAFFTHFPKSTRIHAGDGYTYLGDWDAKAKRPQGKGLMSKPAEKSLSVGNFDRGLMEDVNGYFSSAIEKYEGGFYEGKFNGSGRLEEKIYNTIYTGEFLKGRKHGDGIIVGEGVKDYFTINVDGTSATYEGSWVDNNPEGKGELKTKNGKNWYKGNFKAGKFDGNGELRLDIGMSEGVRIKGTFKNGEPNGLMKVSQWTFLGLVKSEVTASAYSWQDLIEPIKKVAGDFSDILTGYSSVNGSNVKVTEWEEMWWALSDDKIKYIKCGQYISNIVFHTDDDRPYSVTGYDGKFLGSFKSYEEAITSATQNINSVCY